MAPGRTGRRAAAPGPPAPSGAARKNPRPHAAGVLSSPCARAREQRARPWLPPWPRPSSCAGRSP
ncbi:hypothetical protein EIO00_19040 [Thermomonospora catenispora]|nr:hypothetical protein EIO00_19040 [Thermomonospora catenispora]